MLEYSVGMGVMQVRRGKRKLTGSKVSHGERALPVPAILGPLLGLGYILVLPFIGTAAFFLFMVLRGTGSRVIVQHNANHLADC